MDIFLGSFLETNMWYSEWLYLWSIQYPLYVSIASFALAWFFPKLVGLDYSKTYQILNKRKVKPNDNDRPTEFMPKDDFGYFKDSYKSDEKANEEENPAVQFKWHLLLVIYLNRLLYVAGTLCLVPIITYTGGMGMVSNWITVPLSLVLFEILFFYKLQSECPIDFESERGVFSRFFIRFGASFKESPVFFSLFQVAGLATALSTWLFFYESCMCFYFGKGPSFLLYSQYHTAMMRWFYRDTACKDDNTGPCQVYFTLPENSTHYTFLNIHTHTGVKSVEFSFYLEENPTTPIITTTATTYEMGFLDFMGARNVHSALIGELSPNTTYTFTVKYDGKVYPVSGQADNYKYRTLPDEIGNDTFYFASAGDTGTKVNSSLVANITGEFGPLALFIGGDNAYDNGMTCNPLISLCKPFPSIE